MRRSLARLVGVAALLAPASAAGHPGPKVLETIVATIGERPVLWSEVLKRATPRLIALPADKRLAAKDEIYTQTLEQIVEERLIEHDADRLQITARPDEVDQRIASIAQQQGLSHAELVRDLATRGLSEQDYRDEIRRQIVDRKWFQRRVVPSADGSITLAEARQKRLEQLRAEIDVEVRR